MIVIATVKAQGEKRGGCNVSHNDSTYTNLSPPKVCALKISNIAVIE